MKAYIVDDEPPAIRTIEALLQRFEATAPITILGSNNNSLEAVEEINKLKPNVLFLDIEMPGLNGFEILNHLNYKEFLVVFVTAYRDYAVEAFNIEAFHYILKPISPLSFTKCLQKIEQRLIEKNYTSSAEVLSAASVKGHSIAIRGQEGYQLIDYNEISAIIADGAYSKFVLNNGKALTHSKNLKYNATKLPSEFFKRISRSAIINLEKIKSFTFQDGGTIKLTNNEELLVGKTYRSEVFKYLKDRFVA